MSFNQGFTPRGIDSISGSNGQVITKVSGQWVAAPPAGGGAGGGSVVLDPVELNLIGEGTAETPLYLRMNPVFTTVTASFSGNGSQVTNLTASNINNFTANVRGQLSAGTNMQYSGGAFALSDNPSVTSVSASAGFSGSQTTVTEVNTDFIDFVPTSNAAVPHSTGRLSYNSDLENLQFDLPNDTTTLNIGKQLLLKVTNNTAATIAKGKVVKINGSAGSSDTMYVVTASWENDAGSADTIGFLASELAVGETGYAVLSGMLYGINTDVYSAGQMLYLSSSGNFTTTEPTPPNHTVRLGHIARVQTNNGSIFVRVQNGYEINELHDVLITSPANYDLLVRDTDGLWKNTKTLAGNYTFSGTNTFTAAQNVFNNDIVVNGTASIAQLNTVSQQSLLVGDKYITILSGSSTHVDMDGAGILFGSASADPTTGDQTSVAHIVYRKGNAPSDYTSDYIEVYPSLRTTGVLSGSNITGSNTGDETTSTIKSKLGTAGVASEGYLTQTDWNTFNNKQNTITLTTTGNSGAATLVGDTLNIPQYSSTSIIPSVGPSETFRGVTTTNGSTTLTTVGGGTTTAIASAILRSNASTTTLTRQIRLGQQPSSTSSNAPCGQRGSALLWYVGGGFRFTIGMGVSDTAFSAGCKQFYGMANTTSLLTFTDAVSISSLLNIIGFGSDGASDTNLQFFYNDGSGTATKIDLGASFPSNRTSGAEFTGFYVLEIYNPGNSTDIYYRAKNLENHALVEGVVSTNVPADTVGLTCHAQRNMPGAGGVNGTGRFDFSKFGVYSL